MSDEVNIGHERDTMPNTVKEIVIFHNNSSRTVIKTKHDGYYKRPERFFKIMQGSVDYLLKLEAGALKLFLLLSSTLKMDETYVDCDYNIHKDYYSGSRSSFYRNLNILLEKGIMKKHRNNNKTEYHINPYYARNGK